MTNLFDYTRGRPDAPIVLVGEAWGASEARERRPFVGESGQELDRMLAKANIPQSDCLFTNLINERPPNNDFTHYFYRTKEGTTSVRGLYPWPSLTQGMERLFEQLRAYPRRMVIGLGNYPTWALSSTDSFSITSSEGRKVPRGIAAWRGSQLYCIEAAGGTPFMPTYHPAAILRMWAWRASTIHDFGRVKSHLDGKLRWEAPPYDFLLRPTYDEVMLTLSMLLVTLEKGPTRIAVDIETRNNLIACIGLAWSRLEAVCIPFMSVETPSYWSNREESHITLILWKVLHHPNAEIVGQNFSYDLQYLQKYLLGNPPVHFDTMLGHHLCWPGTPKALHYLSSLYCEHHVYWKDEGKTWDANVPEEVLWRYNCLDAVKTWEITGEEEHLISHLGLVEQMKTQMAQQAMVVRMMLRGVRIDQRLRQKYAGELQEAIFEREVWLDKIMPTSVSDQARPKSKKAAPWYHSPTQQATIFYDVLGIPEVKSRKTGNRTCDDEALQAIKKRKPLLARLCNVLAELRSLGVFFNTFITAAIDPDGRMRCYFNPAGTETFRLSSSTNAFGRGTNLQTIPAGTED